LTSVCFLTPYCAKIATIFQSFIRNKHYFKLGFSRTAALDARPQIKGVVTEVRTMSPKKPNSATRHVAKVKLTTEHFVTARIPGVGYRCSKHNRVLVNGGRANDLPGVGYTLVRGVYDFASVLFKKKRRSVYGTSRPDGYTTHVRRKERGQRGTSS
jgi:small subunit ribosomal protein S12